MVAADFSPLSPADYCCTAQQVRLHAPSRHFGDGFDGGVGSGFIAFHAGGRGFKSLLATPVACSSVGRAPFRFRLFPIETFGSGGAASRFLRVTEGERKLRTVSSSRGRSEMRLSPESFLQRSSAVATGIGFFVTMLMAAGA